MDKIDRKNELHQEYIRVGGPEFDMYDVDQAGISYAYNTCAIEGNSITLGEAESIIVADKVVPGRTLTKHLEIKDAHYAFKQIFLILSERVPMSEYLAMMFHRLNTSSWLDPKYVGVYKSISNGVSGRTTRYP